MIITEVVNKLQKEYHNSQNMINKSLKYSFNYYNSHTAIYYLQENGLQNQILLAICVNGKYYLTTIYFSLFNYEYEIKPYIPNEIYSPIKKEIFEKDNYSPEPYFQKICSVILNNNPIITNYKTDTNKYKFYAYKAENECPFFETFIRKNISNDMEKKVRERYCNDLANKIIKYCYQTRKTLRFTSDINRAHDIIISMNSQ